MSSMKYHLITYGCQMNTADSEEMAQPLRERGFLATASLHEADIVMMNTCTVREQAEHRADSNIGRLRVWKNQNPNRILIVAGCAASRWGDSIQKKYPFIDLVSPATRIEEFPDAVAKVLKDRWDWEGEVDVAFSGEGKSDGAKEGEKSSLFHSFTPSLTPSPSSFLFGDDRTAYVTIMRGCNYSCSYCIVPQVRGREKYRPMPDILREIRTKVAEGYREVMLLGQTVNSYYYRTADEALTSDYALTADYASTAEISDFKASSDSKASSALKASSAVYDFSDLLRAVSAVDGVDRIRFMSPHPRHMKDRVIEAMAESSKVARHIHLPVQSGSDRLLGTMKRLYSRAEYLAIVKKLRAAIPGILITTDIIVGYPGETTEDLEGTLSLMRDVRFDGLFAFKYSPRPGTASADLADDVPDQTKEDRLQQVLALNTEIKNTITEVSA